MGKRNCNLVFVILFCIVWYEYYPVECRLNCSSISHDGSLVVGGFSDSSVKVCRIRSEAHILFVILLIF
jgi:transcription initiation factor TFIID subunit 5